MIRVNQALDSPEVLEAAVAVNRLLRRTGPSEIFSSEIPASPSRGVRNFDEYVTSGHDAQNDVLLVHIAGHHPQLIDWLMRRPERVIAACHSVDALASDGLRLLRHRADAALVFSPDDVSVLERLGFSTVISTTLPLDPAELIRTPPDEHAVAGISGPLLLAAGPVTPQRCVHHLLLAYDALVTYERPDANLVVAGPSGPPDYVAAIRRMMAGLELTQVRLDVWPTDNQLAAYYRRSSMFISASEHESLGLDLRRALAFGAPIVARRATGVARAVGSAAFLVGLNESPSLLSAAMAAVLDQAELHDELAARSREAHEGAGAADGRSAFVQSLLAVL
ncbi:MAG: glycosyltransferase family 4 protein [Acidimicrobiaceae bacterium]|nr:glycosyltransferase family 4 protein [Acidimicrobiaceae bacterium]